MRPSMVARTVSLLPSGKAAAMAQTKTCGTFLIRYTFQTFDQVRVFDVVGSVLSHVRAE